MLSVTSQTPTKEEAMVVMDGAMELRFPYHIRRIKATSENKTNIEDCSTYIEHLKELYKNAHIESMHWTNQLLHQALNKIPDIEVYKEIRKSISAYLSEMGSAGKADLPNIINKIKSIEADRRSRGQPTSGGRNNKNNRVHNKQSLKCYICNEYGHTRDKCQSLCKWCDKPVHKNRDCDQKPERGRSRNRSEDRKRVSSKSKRRSKKGSPHPSSKKNKKKSSTNKNRRTSLNESQSSAGTSYDDEEEE